MLEKRPLAGHIQPCETRLALSASLVGELLAQALDLDGQDSVQDGSSPDLVEQASSLRSDSGLDGSGQTIAVIDSGVAWDHVALGSGFGPGYRVVGGWDFAESDAVPYDDGPRGYHGTHVAGLLAGDEIGVAPGADLVALRVFDDQGYGKLEWIEQALQWVHDNQDSFASPITTVNLSIGAAVTSENLATAQTMLSDELSLLAEDEILVFAAAGNQFDAADSQGILYPASDPNVVAVSSLNSSGGLSEFSNRTDGVLAARGESINSAVPEHVYGWDGSYDDMRELDGSSMATPQIAAASVLVRQALEQAGIDPTPEAILERLTLSESTDAFGSRYHEVDLIEATDVSDSQAVSTDQFTGTSGSDQIQLDLRNGVRVISDGNTIDLSPNDPSSPLVIDAAGGADAIEILGSENAERLVARAVESGASTLTTNDFQIELIGFETIRFEGGGGSDRATLYDTSGDDTLRSQPGQAELSGIGFRFDVVGVARTYVHATSGGNDTAFLNDSAGDDQLAVRPQFTSLRSPDAFQFAYGFERVYAYAGAGGNDSAEIYDSALDDTLSISSSRSMISAEEYYVSARGFASVTAHSTAGGIDTANLYSSELDSQWHATNDMVQLTDVEQHQRIARGFDQVNAFEQFQPVDLLSHRLDLSPFDEDPEEQARLEAESLRAVFENLE